MKRSLTVVISLLLACIFVLSSCNTTRPDSLPIPTDNVEATVPSDTATETEVTPEAEPKAEPEAKTEPEVELTIEPEIKAEPKEEPASKETAKVEEEPKTEPEESLEDEADENTEAEADEEADEEELEEEVNLETKPEINTEAGTAKDTIPAAKNYSGVMHYTSTSGNAITCDVDFILDYKALIDGSNKTYSQELAKLSMLYSADIYKNLYVEFKSGTTGGSDTATNLGKKLGLQNVKSYTLKASSYSVDKDDITEFFVGHKKFVYNGVTREIIIVAVRGTNDTNAEWSSNFDVGADTKEYYNAMGKNHPDWKNKANHKGFDVTANRVYDKLTSYISQYVDATAQTSILVTGHSRGAAVANILGQMFTDNTSYKTYGYTFAAPNTTTAKNAGNYKNIFNIINKDDIIPYLPLSSWGFTNYGVTKSVSVRELYSYEPGFFGKEKEGAFKWFIGESYNDDGGTQRTLDCFAALATCREDLYKLDKTSHGKITYTGLLGLKYNKKDATAKYNELATKLKNEKLTNLCTLSIVQSGTKYYVEIVYCPAFFMQMLANMTTGVGDLLGYTLGTKYNDAKLSFIASSGKVGVGGMEHPHMQPTYYLIVRNNFATLDELNK